LKPRLQITRSPPAWTELPTDEGRFCVVVATILIAGRKTLTRTPGQACVEQEDIVRKARPNRFASRMREAPLVVLVDPDVAEVFTTPESVNQALRALITAIPKNAKRKAVAG